VAADPLIGRADAGARAVASPRVQAAVEDLFERHGERVLAYCRRRLRTTEEAEDALQTTFLYACRGLQRGVVPETEIAWLLKIAHNVCLSQWDSDRRRRRLELVQDPDRIDAAAPAAAPSDRENVIALETALGGLTELQRRAILLREWRGLSYQEIAVELDLSSSAVETLIFRARRSLARGLERQDVGRSRLARCLDVGGLFSALKSALGLGGSTKVAATLAVGAAVLAAAIPDVPKQNATERPRPATVESPRTTPAAPVVGDSAQARPNRDAPRVKRAAFDGKKESRRDRRSRASATGPQAVEQGGPATLPPLEDVATGLNQTVGGVTKKATGAVDGLTQKVLPGVVPPVGDVGGGVLGPGDGGLLPGD
jgi:RNA polymerase sigma-70 factor, ECF subfamily